MGERVFKTNMLCSLKNIDPCVVSRFMLAEHQLPKAVLLGILYAGDAAHLHCLAISPSCQRGLEGKTSKCLELAALRLHEH